MGPVRSPETSVLNQPTLLNIPEDRRIHLTRRSNPEDGRIWFNSGGIQRKRGAVLFGPVATRNCNLEKTTAVANDLLTRDEAGADVKIFITALNKELVGT